MAGTSTRIFIDFWNFQLNWNERSGHHSCDWKKLPSVLLDQTKAVLQQVSGEPPDLDLEETRVQASVKLPSEANLKRWLTNFLDKQPSVRVKIHERRVRSGGIWCNTCKTEIQACPSCKTAFQRAPEKGVDAAIVTDLLSLAHDSKFDVAILLSSDADLIPAVEHLQERGLKVINATWAGHGYDLAHTCWGHFQLDSVIGLIDRGPIPGSASATAGSN